jgi:hypothetical protein
VRHTTIRDIAIAFGFSIDHNSEKKVNDSVDRLKSYASKALGAIAIYFTVRGLSSLAEAAANAEALKSQFSQVFGDIEDQAAKTMEGIADVTGVSAGRMKGSFVQIAAFAKTSGMGTEDALGLTDRAMRAVADSAAFYDKSLEDVTASLQSFLKGNFANDAALGLSATETTRNAAANALYGKSFKDLAEAQKQLTLLKMVEDANSASGALGQAARESDTWGNQLGNLKQSLLDLKVAAGGAFLKPAIQVLKLLSKLAGHAARAVRSLTAEGRLLNRMFERIANWLKKAQAHIERFVKKAGGAENAFKLLAIAGGSVFAALNAGKILSFVKRLGKLLTPVSAKILAIAAVIALIALAVDDLISFMRGNNSVIGEIFKRMGVDADAARAAVINTWNAIKTNLEKIWLNLQETAGAAWGAIKATAEAAFVALKAFWSAWGDEIKAVFERLWETLGQSFQNATDAIIGILDLFTAIFSGDWKSAWDAVKDIAAAAWDEIVLVFTTAKDAIISAFEWLYDELGPLAAALGVITSAVIGYKLAVMAAAAQQAIMAAAASGMTAAQIAQAAATKAATVAQWLLNAALTANPVGLVVALIAGLVAAFVLLWKKNEGFRNFFISMWEGLKNFFSSVAGFFKNAFASIGDFFKAVWDGIAAFFKGIWDLLVTIVTTYIAIWKAVFTGVIDFFKAIWGGASGFFSDIWDGLVDKVKGAADKIKNFLQPILDIVGGVKDAIGGVTDKVKGAVGGAVDKAKGVLGFAKGTERTPDTFVAGEEGPELIAGARGRKVFTASETDGLVGAIGSAAKAILSSVAVAREALSKMPAPSSDGGRTDNAAIVNAIRSFGSDIAVLAKGAMASPQTAQSMISQTTSRSITQNVSFTNTFNGERAIQKRSAESMNRSVKDVTGQLAAALAYTR